MKLERREREAGEGRMFIAAVIQLRIRFVDIPQRCMQLKQDKKSENTI